MMGILCHSKGEKWDFLGTDISRQLLTSDGESHPCLWIQKRISKSCRGKKKYIYILHEILNSLKMISGYISAAFYRVPFIPGLLGVLSKIPGWKWKISIVTNGLWKKLSVGLKMGINSLWNHFKNLESRNYSVCGANSINSLSCTFYFHPEVDKKENPHFILKHSSKWCQ